MATSTPDEKDIEAIHQSPAISSSGSSQLDDTYEAYKNNQGLAIDPAEAKKTLRKIDLRVVPILFFTYLLQYLDKNGINYASAFGFIEGTNLGKNGYQWLGESRQVSQSHDTRIGLIHD
jgi:hypothetical protein